jgi:hypothetical protein
MTTMKMIRHISEEIAFLKILLYADPGVGKTYFCGTAAEVEDMKNVLFIKAEDGVSTVDHQDVFVTSRIKTVMEVTNLFWSLANNDKIDLSRVVDGKTEVEKYDLRKVKTVVIDSATALLDTCVVEVVEANCKKDPNKDPDRVTFRDWGDVNFILKRLFARYFSLEKNIIVTAHVRRKYLSKEPEKQIVPIKCIPELSPKLSEKMLGLAHCVWWMDTVKDPEPEDKDNPRRLRVLHTQPKEPWFAKTRGYIFADGLPNKIVNPSLTLIHKLLLLKDKEND